VFIRSLQAGADKNVTILLLDDDSNTLIALNSILQRTEACVIGCVDEPCAVRHCMQYRQGIDLMIADVVLPDSNGPAVVRKLRPLQPLMRLLYISGFSMTELQRRGLLSAAEMAPGSVEFLQKPFSPKEFLDNVQRLLVV
jgi:response regulator RpfG family c-di-GMP phosphodiesterase